MTVNEMDRKIPQYIHTPCNVGDVVYSYCSESSTISPYFIEKFNVVFLGYENEYMLYTFKASYYIGDELVDSIDFELNDIGKTVFLTREEAERALEESK